MTAQPTGPWRRPTRPSAHGWSNPYAGERVVFDAGRAVSGTVGRDLLVGAVIGAVFGGSAVVTGILGVVAGQGVGPVVMMVIGLPLLAMPVISVARAKLLYRPRHLVVEPPGLRWEDPRGAQWFTHWPELASVLVHGHISPDSASREPVVVLHLREGDQDFAARHPDMAHLRHTDGAYRVVLAYSPTCVPELDAVMRRFAPVAYRGVALSEGTDAVPVARHYPGVLAARS